PPPHPHAPTAQAALDWDAGADPAGDVEVLLFTRPFVPDGDLHLMCALQQPDSRGVLDLDRISYGYLSTEHDRRGLRHCLRPAGARRHRRRDRREGGRPPRNLTWRHAGGLGTSSGEPCPFTSAVGRGASTALDGGFGAPDGSACSASAVLASATGSLPAACPR